MLFRSIPNSFFQGLPPAVGAGRRQSVLLSLSHKPDKTASPNLGEFSEEMAGRKKMGKSREFPFTCRIYSVIIYKLHSACGSAGKEGAFVKYKKWNIGAPGEEDVALLREAGYPGLMALVLAARGVTSPEKAAEFLDRDRKLTLSPMLMREIGRAHV